MDRLVAAVPPVRTVIDETRQSNGGEILPHVEMWGLTRWLIFTFRLSRQGGVASEPARRAVSAFLAVMESGFHSGDQDVDDLIGTSFLENLHQAGEDLPALRSELPPKMSRWYESTFEQLED